MSRRLSFKKDTSQMITSQSSSGSSSPTVAMAGCEEKSIVSCGHADTCETDEAPVGITALKNIRVGVRFDERTVDYGDPLVLRSNFRKCYSASGMIESATKTPGFSSEGSNHLINLDVNSHKDSNSEIVDSHTAYRKIIDQEISQLKLKLSETQALSDTLQHELNHKRTSCQLLQEQLDIVTQQKREKENEAVQLETVVHHLQENTRETGEIRAELQSTVVELDNDCHRLRHHYKRLGSENRKLKKNLEDTQQNLEGSSMQNQGLKSENEWLKKQLWSGNKDATEQLSSDSELDNSEHGVAITGIRQFLSPPKIKKRRRRRQAQGPLHIDGVPSLAEDPHVLEDIVVGYTSVNTDLQQGSTNESLKTSRSFHSSKPRPLFEDTFMKKLAMRHGVSNADDGSNSHSLRTDDTPSHPRDFRPANSTNAPNIHIKNRNALQRSSYEVLSSISQMNLNKTNASHSNTTCIMDGQEPPSTEQQESSQWNLWSIFGKGRNEQQTEEKTTEESESSHCSEDFVQFPKGSGTGSRPAPSIASNEKPAKSILFPRAMREHGFHNTS